MSVRWVCSCVSGLTCSLHVVDDMMMYGLHVCVLWLCGIGCVVVNVCVSLVICCAMLAELCCVCLL